MKPSGKPNKIVDFLSTFFVAALVLIVHSGLNQASFKNNFRRVLGNENPAEIKFKYQK